MKEKLTPVSLTIMGKEYKIACSEEEQNALLESAQLLDGKMHEIRDTGKVIGPDRIAVMAALNIAHELNQLQNKSSSVDNFLTEHITRLRLKIENLLESM